MDYALKHPGLNLIGVERLLGRIRKIDRKGRRLGLRNVRGIRIEARYFLRYLLPRSVVAALHIYFPDPWPKARHAQHRLVDSKFSSLVCPVLAGGGRVYLRTDDESYFTAMRESMGVAEAFHEVRVPADLAAIQTDFERSFRERGKAVFSTAYAVRSA